MIEAQADVVLGESMKPAVLAHHKVYHGGVRMILLPALALAAGLIAASILARLLALVSLRLEGFGSLLWIAGAILGFMAAVRILPRGHLQGFLNGLRKMGTPPAFATRFRFDGAGLSIDSDRLSWRAPWTSVLFIIPAPDHWLVQIDTTTMAIPRRAFADEAAEQGFLDLAAANPTPEAKARSVLARP
jgi:hypothetical protein